MTAATRERRREVARLRGLGLSQRAIAAQLDVSQGCIRDDLLRLPTAVDLDERQAIVTDARRRLVELQARKLALWPDRDDPVALSELVMIDSQMRHALQALRELTADAA